MLFETNRLYIRRLAPGDLPDFHTMQSNPTVMRFTSGQAQTYEENQAELEKVIGRYETPGNDFWVWAVLDKQENTFIGTCALMRNEEGEQEIGYRLDEPSWGKGYGTELTMGLMAYASGLGFSALMAYVYDEHAASIRVLEKAGFELEERFFNKKLNCMDRRYIYYFE
ncbi:MAG: GNAT family N-acetyltransferase [Lewinellaceae bacterium]|nr:GNAT family N-acetyltransferase [Lewinellaceae bacterium]